MPNIEKLFIEKISEKHPESVDCIFELMQSNALNYDGMKHYLIRERYKEMKLACSDKFQKMQAYADIGEEFCLTMDRIRRIVCGY
jgi:hypothetical protein